MMGRILALLLLVPALAAAEPPPNATVKQGQAFKVTADHDGLNTTDYRLYRNGVVLESKPVAQLTAGSVSFDQPATLAPGLYAYDIAAVGDGGEVKSVTPFLVRVLATLPNPLKNFRIQLVGTVAGDGTVTLSVATVEFDQ